MSLHKKLYIFLIPALLVAFTFAGFVAYHHQLVHQKEMVVDSMIARVNQALSASEYEQLSLGAHANNIATSPPFIRYIQNPDEASFLSTLEHSVIKSLQKSHNERFGIRHVFVIDPSFNLVLSTYRNNPFEDLLIPDRIYNITFDIYTNLFNSGSFIDNGLVYISLTGELRYLYSVAVDPSLVIRDRRARQNDDRYLLVLDGPLERLSDLLNELGDDANISLLIEPMVDTSENVASGFIIREMEDSSNGVTATLSSSHFQAKLEIDDAAFSSTKLNIAMQTAVQSVIIFTVLLSIIHLVVHFQLIAPLKKLVTEVSTGGLQLRYFKRSNGRTEVDKFKNAYIDSLTELKFEAEFDQVTRLANRRSFFNYLDLRLASYSNNNCYILCWDIKEFRKINDLYG
ncbi:GGDEF domain-containing protein, partial [Vibrio sp. FNV 38]|nr:GGDEF domain-containing protein [Vibrio sp. FNV 38]